MDKSDFDPDFDGCLLESTKLSRKQKFLAMRELTPIRD